MSTKLGNAKYGSDFVKRKYWKLKDGESTFRILPPMGELADEGIWSRFYNVHYGYKNSKGEMRVFQSPLVKNRKTKMIEVPDAALERIEKLKSELEKAKAAGNKAVVEKLLTFVGGQKAQYNLDSNHYVNAMDLQGNIGVLKFRHRAKLALDATIKALRDSGVDPLSAEDGRFFVFRRSGMGLETTFQVEVLKKRFKVDGVGEVEQAVVHSLTPDIIERLSKEAGQLDNLYKRPTSEEVAKIVKESDLFTGKSSAVDEILDAKKEDDSNDDGSEEEHDGGVESAESVVAAALGQPLSTAVTTPTAALVSPTNLASKAIASAPAHTPPLATAVTVPLSSLAATVVMTPVAAPKAAPAEQSDEDFLRSLGL